MRKIPPSIYQYLVETFGGIQIKIEKNDEYCLMCSEKLKLIRQLKQS